MTYEIAYANPVEGLDLEDRNREIRYLLTENDCEVTFTKVDGSLRTMPCTLRAEALPKIEIKENKEPKLAKPETISVWCLDKNEWRAFKVANVKLIKVIGKINP